MVKEIPLTQGLTTIVDDEDFESLARFKWYAWFNKGSPYAARDSRINEGRRRHRIHMHRVIAGTPKGLETDHKNHDTLDNRRENLRTCTHSQNMANQHNQSRKSTLSSRFKGVSWNSERQCWRANIRIDGRTRFLGQFDDEKDAASAYDAKARELFGEFALTNFPLDGRPDDAIVLLEPQGKSSPPCAPAGPASCHFFVQTKGGKQVCARTRSLKGRVT